MDKLNADQKDFLITLLTFHAEELSNSWWDCETDRWSDEYVKDEYDMCREVKSILENE